jgi:hypothetical protein
MTSSRTGNDQLKLGIVTAEIQFSGKYYIGLSDDKLG